MAASPSPEMTSSSLHELGGGALFWMFLAVQNHTRERVERWAVTVYQAGWSGTLSPETPSLKAGGRSGAFELTVLWWRDGQRFAVALDPACGSEPGIRCGAGGAAAIGIVADTDGSSARYWTMSDLVVR
jgi:hypothetical protein